MIGYIDRGPDNREEQEIARKGTQDAVPRILVLLGFSFLLAMTQEVSSRRLCGRYSHGATKPEPGRPFSEDPDALRDEPGARLAGG